MTIRTSLALMAACFVAGLNTGCASTSHDPHQGSNDDHSAQKEHVSQWTSINSAVCVLHATEGNSVTGHVRFKQTGKSVKVVAQVSGLTPNQKHGFHIHELGDISAADGTSAGDHYDPDAAAHSLPPVNPRHAGDLGNLEADAKGEANYKMTVNNISIAGLKNPIIGRAIIVHAKPDDGGQPTGNAGARIAQGVIGIAK